MNSIFMNILLIVMGNGCEKCIKIFGKNKQEQFINEDGKIKKRCSEKELNFWIELEKLSLVKISKILKSKKIIEFNYSDMFIENFISIGQIMEYLLTEQNYFYFLTIFELSIAIMDFLQVVINLKNKYEINKENFFFIDFNKIYLQKDGSEFYTKFVYLDEKLNEAYTMPEIIHKDDRNMLSMYSVLEENGKSYQMLLSTINTSNVNYKSTTSQDMNNFFYSNCNERYQKLRNNYSLNECNKFYAENLLNFVTKVLIKKTVIDYTNLKHDFDNFKYIFRHTLKAYFKNNELNLQNLKIILTNFYLNNFEFGNVKSSFEKKLNVKDSNVTNDLACMEKVLSFKQSGVKLMYGNCQFEYDDMAVTEHNVSFISDKKEISICIDCINKIILKKVPEGRSSNTKIQNVEMELKKAFPFFEFKEYLKYYSSYFSSNTLSTPSTKNTLDDLDEFTDILIYKRVNIIYFEIMEWDSEREEVKHTEILNLDLNVKNTINKSTNTKK